MTDDDHFVTPGPLPNDDEQEILECMIEECSEIIQRATKILRFGVHEVQPGQPLTNKIRLSEEIGDLNAVINLAIKANLVSASTVVRQVPRKLYKLRKYLQSAARNYIPALIREWVIADELPPHQT